MIIEMDLIQEGAAFKYDIPAKGRGNAVQDDRKIIVFFDDCLPKTMFGRDCRDYVLKLFFID